MRRILEILTPENVYVEYELAGLGSRCVAYFIDSLIQLVLKVIAFAAILLSINWESFFENLFSGRMPVSKYPLIAGIGYLVLFAINMLYFVIFEMIMNGQTPGKKIMKLRVIRENGEPIGFFDSLLRNFLRVIDNSLTANLLGSLFIVYTKNYKRIGDYAANSIVVKIRKEEKALTVDNLIKQAASSDEQEKTVNIYPVTNLEYGILKEFLARRDNLGDRRPVFAFHLNKYFMNKFNIEKPFTSPYEFFEEIIRMNSGI